MDKKWVTFFRNKFPKLFAMVTRSYFLAKTVTELDRLRYWYCMLMKKPYFGTVYLAGQTWEERKIFMSQLIKSEMEKSSEKHLSILEIGSWAGNSAVLWGDAIKKNNGVGTVFCVDPWEPYLKSSDKEKVNVATLIMDRALAKGKIFKLFLHNIKSSNLSNMVFPIKGSSSDILPLLKDRSFDVIYVDGDHSYSGIMKDLQRATSLLAPGGVLCGDDLDLQADQIDKEFSEIHKERNIIIDPKTKKIFHPGVCLAVADFFKGPVSSYSGFWAMRSKGDAQWEDVKDCV